jgi:amino acid transporter
VFASNALLIILGIDAPPFPLPYIILFLLIVITAMVLLAKFPSLRKYRRKRNIIIYSILTVALVFTLFLAYESPRKTILEYYLNDYHKFPDYCPATINQFNLTCHNRGDKANSFYMIINSVNTSFPTQPQEIYVSVNDTTIKVLFTLGESGSSNEKDTKRVLFNINENVTGFSIKVKPETRNDLIGAGSLHAMQYVWNGTENCYKLDFVLGGQP